MRDLLVYVAGPISKGDLHANVRQATDAGKRLMRAGIPCIVPHLTVFMGMRLFSDEPLTPRAYLPEVLPNGTTHDDWYGIDLAIVRRCDALLRLPGESVGADLEVSEAHLRGIPVFTTVEEVIAWAQARQAA